MKFILGLTQQNTIHSKGQSIDGPSNIKIEEQILPIFHKPKELVALLKKFSNNDSALKYTTHSWDAGRDVNIFKDLAEFLFIAKSEFNKLGDNLKGLNEFLYWKIYNFLFWDFKFFV